MSDIEAFEQFWKAYPRKVAKGAARKAWAKLNPPPALQHKITQALAWQRTQEQWTKDGGQYIPHPATWLNHERWDDEPVQVQPTKGRVSENWADGLISGGAR